MVSRVEVDYNGHVEAGEQCFGSRFCWPGVACAFAKWPCIGKLFFFPNLSLLVPQTTTDTIMCHIKCAIEIH